MDYRNQLKYIKSRQENNAERRSGKGQRKKTKKPIPRREPRYEFDYDYEDGFDDYDDYNSYRYDDYDSYRYDDYERRPRRRKSGSSPGRRYHEPAPRRRSVGVGGADKFFLLLQTFASIVFFASMAWLGILPMNFMAGLIIFLVLLLLILWGKQRSARRDGRHRGSGKGMAVTTSCVLLLLSFYCLKVNGALDQIAVGEESGNYTEEHILDVTKEPFNVYISGIDVYGELNKQSRSDVNLIATVNPKTQKILLTTTPRDYYVKIPGVSGEKKDKLTHAGVYGIDTSIATLENLYEIDIPFYVRVNFTSVEEIVDVMGGVDVESEVAFTTSKAAGKVVDVKKGKNHFNGKEALAFARERKAFKSGDNQRGKNQQVLMTGLLKEAMSPKILLHANSMINSVAGNADTNMSERQIKSLVRMQVGRMKGWDIESVAATGDDSGKQYCFSYSGGPLYVTVPNAGSVQEIQRKMREYMGK